MERTYLWNEMRVIANSQLGKIFCLSDLLAGCQFPSVPPLYRSVKMHFCLSTEFQRDSDILEPLYSTRQGFQWQIQSLLLTLDPSY